MENLTQVKYLKEFNQLGLIGNDVLKCWVRGSIENSHNISKSISDYIHEVDSLSGYDVTLGGCYTNLSPTAIGNYGSNLMVFPILDDEVSYTIRDDVECLVSTQEDPRIICPSRGLYFNKRNAILFFKKNPFNGNRYDGLIGDIFQSSFDLRSIHSKTRRKLIQRAGSLGFGSLEEFA